MFEDNSIWNFNQDETNNFPIWYKLFLKFNEETLDKLTEESFVEEAKEYFYITYYSAIYARCWSKKLKV
jgi:hypothetical protein